MTSSAGATDTNDMPETLPLFPLAGALLLPRGQLPLNIFEPRYVAMVNDVLKSHRMIGMIQPDVKNGDEPTIPPLFKIGCAGRVTQFAEAGDGRYLVTLTGVARFSVVEEITAITPYRQSRVDFASFAADFQPRAGEDRVDRGGVLKALRDFAEENDLQIDWDSINQAPNEALVNALSMMAEGGKCGQWFHSAHAKSKPCWKPTT